MHVMLKLMIDLCEVQMNTIIRRLQFIEYNDVIYLPHPPGWLSGWARHLWFEKIMQVKPMIASSASWKTLSLNTTIRELLEYSDGRVEVRLTVTHQPSQEHTTKPEDPQPVL